MSIDNFDVMLEQIPAPGSYTMWRQGDLLRFELRLDRAVSGRAWLRTNIGNSQVHRDEVIGHVENGSAILDRDWHDLPMDMVEDGCFVIELPLSEVGVFSAKSFFVPTSGGDPQWPDGGNIFVKVESADYCYGNSIYNAFVRQFNLENRGGTGRGKNLEEVSLLDAEGYTVIPPSGTFRDLIGELDFIVGKMKFRIIQLLPIFPVPTTYARMGRFGSPYAALDFFDVDPALAEFDRRTSPLDQFKELVDAVHVRDGRLFLDIPINHTGWASWLQNHHPEWFLRGDDRTFRSPGAWGVTWEDLSELDYSKTKLWHYIADVFLFWCAQGVDGFRCDAGYMIPAPVWRYVLAKVRTVFPDTVFLLEGLGGGLDVTESLLADEGLDWAYSELFQNYDRSAVERYLAYSINVSSFKGKLVHFAETHDNDRLAKRSHGYAMMRTALAALCSSAGAFGMANGVEWFADEKINVHGASPLRWGAEENQAAWIAKLNGVLASHPAFGVGADLRLVHVDGTGNAIALRRVDGRGEHGLLVLINLDDEVAADVVWAGSNFSAGKELFDLLSDGSVEVDVVNDFCSYRLAPAQVLCLMSDGGEYEPLRSRNEQLALAKIAELRAAGVNGVKSGAAELLADPYLFRGDGDGYIPVVTWTWPSDRQRCVMVPPEHLLLIKCPYSFDIRLEHDEKVVRFERSIMDAAGSYFVLLMPVLTPDITERYKLEFRVYEEGVCKRVFSELRYLAPVERLQVSKVSDQEVVRRNDLYALCTNGRGAMAQVSGRWGEIRSQYDAFLAANLNLDCPDDRHVMFTRCRAWLVYRDYSQELNLGCLHTFGALSDDLVEWKMRIPCGMGHTVGLNIRLNLVEGRNAVLLEFGRELACSAGCLPDDEAVQLILRPDVEDRNFHTVTKAMHGAEKRWPDAVESGGDGFVFAPDKGRALSVVLPGSKFVFEPEWSYMVAHPVEGERGLDGSSDLFSPGYFSVDMSGGESCLLQADIGVGDVLSIKEREPESVDSLSLLEVARLAIAPFVVKRDESLTVIAGYPWFLDWGRDTLICLRGMLSADMLVESKEILLQFARFEEGGTLPNMIRGNDQSNRDTSDAPLWFIVSCADLCRKVGDREFLAADCGGRLVGDVVRSIVNGYMQGTANGIKMDPASGLVFSPSHFTWMDTNHPAGTPRVGYPIEIQALWFAAVSFMAEVEPDGEWAELALRVRGSVVELFGGSADIGLSDCLHCSGFGSASVAVADDAVRPNQLFAVTLGLIDEKGICRDILNACESLLVPGAIRSLADREVEHPLEIRKSDGGLLNDPHRPYWGHYRGDEDTRRKPAYHNGTAWSWVFPSYSEAMVMVYGDAARGAAGALLGSSVEVIEHGCIGQVPEVIDGNAPHVQRGCGAQAWGATELYRVLGMMKDER